MNDWIQTGRGNDGRDRQISGFKKVGEDGRKHRCIRERRDWEPGY